VTDAPTPANIFRLGFGFWESKALLSAVELGVFTELAKGPADLATLSRGGSGSTIARRAISLTRLSRSNCSIAMMGATAIRPRRICSSTEASQPMWAAFSRWPIPGFIPTGVC